MQAIQYTGDNLEAVKDFLSDNFSFRASWSKEVHFYRSLLLGVRPQTLLRAPVGHWIVRDENGHKNGVMFRVLDIEPVGEEP